MLLCVVAAPDLASIAASHKHSSCRYFRIVKEINEQEPYLQSLTDAQLKAKTTEFKLRLRAGATLDDLLVEAFALVREVSSRVLRLRHFDAQMVSIVVDRIYHAVMSFLAHHCWNMQYTSMWYCWLTIFCIESQMVLPFCQFLLTTFCRHQNLPLLGQQCWVSISCSHHQCLHSVP